MTNQALDSAEALLSVQGVSKTYPDPHSKGEFQALSNASIDVMPGECVGLIGPSGCGKSTLARIIARLEKADQGSVTFCGQTVAADKKLSLEVKRNLRKTWLGMQMIFQNPEASFSPSMSIGDGIREGLVYQEGYDRKSAKKRVSELLEAVGLPASYASKRCFELSGGECQRAAIARAIIASPRLLICDEPTSALDVTVQARIMELLKELRKETNTAFLFITHNMPLMSEFCTRAYTMRAGTIEAELISDSK